MMNIAQRVRQEAKLPMWPIPDPDPDKKWVRFDCPFCTGNSGNTAAISYERQRFECYRCDTTLGYSSKHNPEDEALVKRLTEEYHDTIGNIVWWVIGKVGNWVEADDLRTQAEWLVWNYSCRAYGGPNDAGMWDEWEAITEGDRNRMAQYVGQALKGDLLSYARDQVNWKRRSGFTNTPREPRDMDDDKRFAVKSVGHMHILADNLSGSQDKLMALAEDDRVSFTSWGNPGCARLRNGLGPVAGHCARCDLMLKTSQKSS